VPLISTRLSHTIFRFASHRTGEGKEWRTERQRGIGGSPMIFLGSCGALLKKSIDFEPKFLLD
jgi:hypothetical protein